jgi:exopolyphosphatase/guanosine-5'-triphosphate,3'-diphosphate pyrophosphatase
MSKTPKQEIVPRWEWRIFGPRLQQAEAWLASHPVTAVQESDETYFLSGNEGIAKIRSDLMDIKVRREVDRDGLERWEPVLKAGFPVSPADVTRVFEALRRAPPPLSRSTWSMDDFRRDFAGAGGPMRAVSVHKRRVRYAITPCALELSDVVADGQPTRTLAVESEDKAAVVALVRRMGLYGWSNTSYARGLAALIDGEPERYAVIDVGTNSVKFHIGQRDGARGWSKVVDRAEVTRLGEGLNTTGAIAPDALQRTAAALRAMVDEARQHGVRAIAVVGTAGVRIAKNRAAVLDALEQATGVTVVAISGEEEARLAYLATVAGLGVAADAVVVFDTGGGSSQFTFGRGTAVDERFSVDVGAVAYTEKFGLARVVTPAVIREVLATLAKDLSRLDGRPGPHAVVGMGGAVTNMAAVMHGLKAYDPDVVQGTVLTRGEIDRQIEQYAARDAEGRRSIVGLQPKRADVILAGACIVRTILEKLGAPSLTVSDRGLRHGLLVERFGS